MQRTFLLNILHLLFINILIKPFWILGIDRVVQNTVGPESYGAYFAVFNFGFLFHIILDFGITNYNNRLVARENEAAGQYFSSIISLKGGLSAIYLLLVLTGGRVIGFNNVQMHLLCFLAFNQILISFILYFRSIVSGKHHFVLDARLSVLDKLLMILICAPLLWGAAFRDDFSIQTFVYVQSVAYLLAFLITAVFAFRLSAPITFTFKSSLIRKILSESYPFALLGVLMTIYYRVDAVMVERMLPLDGKIEAGIYASGYRLLDALNMFGFLFASLLLPIFSRMIAKADPVVELVNSSFKMIMCFSLSVSLASFFYRNEIMQLLYKGSTGYWASVFGILVLGFIFISTVYIFGTLLTAKGSLSSLNKVALAGVLLNIVLNYLLISRYKALGAAWATLISQVLIASFHLIIAWRVFGFKAGQLGLFRLALFAILFIIASFLSLQLSLNWMFSYVALLLLGLVFSTILGFVQPKVLFDKRFEN